MDIKPIKNEDDYRAALNRMNAILDSPDGTLKSDEEEILFLLIENYEEEHYPIGPPDPIEAIKIRMEDLGLQQKDLIPLIGEKGKVSEVLNRKRKLSINMIRRLYEALNISLEVLVSDYKLA